MLWPELAAVAAEFTLYGGTALALHLGHRQSVDFAMALAAGAALYGRTFNPQITLKALAYFDDGKLNDVPVDVRTVLTDAVRATDPLHLPDVTRRGGAR